ncbi:Protein of unknown function [Gryllus bimaculatus]|nr:Protein of unknown function [Gryllus bimaculatus]
MSKPEAVAADVVPELGAAAAGRRGGEEKPVAAISAALAAAAAAALQSPSAALPPSDGRQQTSFGFIPVDAQGDRLRPVGRGVPLRHLRLLPHPAGLSAAHPDRDGRNKPYLVTDLNDTDLEQLRRGNTDLGLREHTATGL